MIQSNPTIESADRKTHGALVSDVFCIAIVGCGPRGMYCLERLVKELKRTRYHTAVQVVVYEPSRHPGAGPIYDPAQPQFLHMNFASRHVNAWTEVDERDLHDDRPTLVQWLERNYPALCDPDAYVPRAIVGEYLHWCFQKIVRSVGVGVELKTIPRKATSIERVGSKWQICAGRSKDTFDEVLITVGHEGWRPSSTGIKESVSKSTSPLHISSVFPTSQQLSGQQVRPQSTVAVRGFSLTFIDAALALTEGRGGKFFHGDGKWHYKPSGLEPQKLVPFSRTGRPILAKPDPRRCYAPPGIDDIWAGGREKLRGLARGNNQHDYHTNIWPVLVATAAKARNWCQVRNGDERYCPDRVADWFHQWSGCQFDEAAAIRRIEHSYQTAIGRQPPDDAWALGEMWRQLYPELVDLVSHGRLTKRSWQEFRRHAVEFERIAFGPPPENVGRMLALMRNGFIDLRFLASPEVIQRGNTIQLRQADQQTEAHVLINAVIPGTREFARDSLLRPLIEADLLTQCEDTGGIKVDHQARPINTHGSIAGGIAVLGRATEGWILGNDTLSRKLHAHPDNWAKMVARRCISQGAQS